MGNSTAVMLKLKSFLDELGWVYDVSGDHLSVPFASTRFGIYSYHVGEYPNERGVMSLRAILLRNVEESGPLYRYVATHQPSFGSLEVSRDDSNDETDIWYAHSTVADSMTIGEFELYLHLFSGFADDLDDELQPLFGGQRASDWMY